MPNETAQLPAVQTAMPPAPMAFTARDEFELALRQAKVYASSTLVPKDYQDNIPNCMIAFNMARRVNADVLMVMQNLYVVHGKPGWSGQFLIATFNQCGRFTAMRFEWLGKQSEKDWGCRAYATEKTTNEKITGAWVTWKMVEAEGWNKPKKDQISKWMTMPEQMFHYRSAAFLVRAYAPEIAMGLPTVEEIGDVIDVTPTAEPSASPLETLKDRVREALPPDTVETKQDATAARYTKDEPPTPFTFAQVADKIAKAKTGDALAEAEDLIGTVTDAAHQLELRKLVQQRRELLQ